MFCKNCGSEIPNDSTFCVKCGAKAEASVQQAQATQPARPVQQYTQTSSTASKDVVSAGLVILSILIPLVGIIMGIVFMCDGKKYAGKTYLLAGIISGVIFACIFSAIITPTTLSYVK